MFEALKSAVRRLQLEIQVYRLVLKDSRVPRLAKWLLGLALAYGHL